ncbi:GMC family oxidoreductase [Ottowia sp. VDI28]|uniref:GMC family oxidoreductase n=1 Tax=Ottowia sp. VDI28 TaxID=3133968 RepID=UPI003C2AF969
MNLRKQGDSAHDFLIVGGGTAGVVLAHRLSADPQRRVLLLEAGHDIKPGQEPRDIRSIFPLSTFNAIHAWPDTLVHWRNAAQSPAVGMPQGRGLGGTSNIMGMWAMRGRPEVYDAWAANGARGWGWSDVLPFFRRLETDHDFISELHGTQGPVPIRRQPVDEWSPLAREFRKAARQQGFADVADMNGDFSDGHCTLPVSRYTDRRGSAGLCYMTAEVRARPNLDVMADTQVAGLVFDDAQPLRAVGVRVRDAQGNERMLRSKEVLVCAGALRSPELLMRAGVGDGPSLQAAGVAVRKHLPGVGANLQNHPMLFMVSFLRRAGIEPDGIRPAGSSYLRWSSGLGGLPSGDMGMSIRSWLSWHALGRRMGAVAPTVSMPFSRGRVTLTSHGKRLVEFNFLQDERDLTRMMQGFRLAAKLYGFLDAVSEAPQVLLNVSNISRLMRYNEPTRFNAVRARMGATLLDVAPDLGKRWISRLARMAPAHEVVADEQRLADFALGSVSGTGHACGTCRMGSEGDPLSVVDAQARVLGCQGLRVIDASIMPLVPSGGTHIPTIMVAEKIANAILHGE